MCDSVAYHPRNDTCKGNQVKQKCAAFGGRGARIDDSGSLQKVNNLISQLGEKYWTGLR